MLMSDERRREIAEFLKTRRMRRQPEELGLPRGRRRRTPGLRREEVATAAGVSAEWYTWLEQAREVRPSAEVLTRIGAALRLDYDGFDTAQSPVLDLLHSFVQLLGDLTT